MHKFYRQVLRNQLSDPSPSSLKAVSDFFSSLGPPSRLNPQTVKKRLDGLAPSTQRTYLHYFKYIERELGRPILDGIKFPKVKKKPHDIYTAEEIDKILSACTDTRDRAMFSVLYDSAARARELLNMTFENLIIENDFWHFNVTGKGNKTRPIYIHDSIPSLQKWLDVHPHGEGPIWVSFRTRPYRPLEYSALHTRILAILDRADVKRRPYPLHLFRHTRLTELATEFTEAELCNFAGWETGSPMAQRYVHLSGRDIRRSMQRLHGINPTEEEPPTRKLVSRQCPRCNTKNEPHARFCSHCSWTLDKKPISSDREEQQWLDGLRHIAREEWNMELRQVLEDIVVDILDKRNYETP